MVLLLLTPPQLLAASALVLAVVLGAVVAYFAVHTRRRAQEVAEREERALRQRDAELTHIRERLEEIYERQQTGTQTQFARVNQELEDLQSSLDAKGRQIDGAQGQLRYELKRHEEEIAALRNQLREAIEVFAAAALPANRPAAPALPAPHEAPAPEAPPAAPASAPNEDAPQVKDDGPLKDDTELLEVMFGGTQLDDESGDEEAAPEADEPPRSFTARSVLGEAAPIETNDDFEFVDVAPPKTPTSQPVSWTTLDDAAEPASSSADDGPSFHSGDGMGTGDAFARPARPTFSTPALSLDSETGGLEPIGADPLETKSGPDAGDLEDLTALSVVDEPTQASLYALGVTTVEAIARWSRADARRIAGRLTGVSEDDIMDRWVFEAQAVLFDRYQDELRRQRVAS